MEQNNILDKRFGELLEGVDYALSECHVTTTEVLLLARQLAVSAMAQIVEDNPTCDAQQMIDVYTKDLRQALNRRIFPPRGGVD